MRRSLQFFLCLLPTLNSTLAIIDFSQYRKLPDNFCDIPSTTNTHFYNHFIDSNPNISFNSDNVWTINTRVKCDPSVDSSKCGTYNLEGVRKFESPLSLCTYCPYHLDPFWSSESNRYVDQSSQDFPMYGPCLDKAPSLKMTCLQHYAFYPQKVFGKFFFPKQRPVAPSFWSEYFEGVQDLPQHRFLYSGVSSSPYNLQNQERPPSSYGLGKNAVESNLEGIEFRYISNQSINEVLTQQFKKPFQDDNGVEQWMKWAQYFCFAGCHRHSRQLFIDMQKVNINDDPELAFLSVFKNEGSIYQPVCRPCPRYTASYNWIDVTSSPAHPKLNPWADQCYPWFGAIPTVILMGERYGLNTTFRTWEPPLDLVFSPERDSEVHMLVCPVNTFNRVCAHTLEALYNNAPSSPIACRPCPSGGYHTGGKEGQWYCQPPPGKVFKSPGREILQSEITDDVWGDRDKMSIYPELECGPERSHCRQCDEYNLRETTPEQFNELLVFSLLLAEEICPESSFCPDAFTKTRCPVEVPWSPAGSWHISNCTCSKGSYFNGSSCIPCTTKCSTPGYYLPKSQCIEKNGATKDAPCTKCNNIPDEWAIADGFGVELRAGFGTCPYHCLWGSEMYVINASIGNCEKKRVCLPPRVRKNKEGRFVYKENLVIDSFKVEGIYSSIFSCIPSSLFTDQLSKIDSEWYQQPQSCIGVCDTSRICYAANKSSVVDPTVPWYSFSSILNCSLCPDINELPPKAYLQIDTGSDLQLGVQYCQDPKIFCSGIADELYYFNRSAWLCQSCDERERDICPPSTRLRGGGCLGVNSPFNTTVPSADCVQCTIRVPALNESKGKLYLNYRNSSAVGGCSIDPCPPLPGPPQHYWGRPCGADFAGEYSPCSIDCPLNHFRKAECTGYANLLCQNCTEKRVGYKKISNCSLTADSEWQLCDAGDYCDDSGSIRKCPSGRTSLRGAKDLSECFCKVGTQEDAKTNLCVPMQCPNTVIMPNLPGLSLNSTHYMTLDLETLSSTKCVPCSSTSPSAYTRGDGLEITSCICPRGYYGLYNNDRTQIQCMPCPLSPSCTNQKMPASCWEGDLKLTNGQSFPCVCTNAPFTSVNPLSCSSICLSNFLPTATSTNRLIRSGSNSQVSGSSIYSVRKGQITNVWNRFFSYSGYQNFNNTIKSIALTGYMDDSVLGNEEGQNLQVYHYEYVFWSIADAGVPVVFSALLQENTVDMPQQTLASFPQWLVFASDFLMTDTIIGIAASKWNVMEPFFSNGNNRDPWIYVAALIRAIEGGGLFYMKAKVFNTTNKQNQGFWEDAEYNLTLPFPVNIQHATPVSIAHSTKQLGEKSIGSEGGFFFIAFNVLDPSQTLTSCGGLFSVSPILGNNIMLKNNFCSKLPSAVSITSMALTLNPDSSMPMILLALSSGNALKIESPMQTEVSLFFPATTVSPPILNFMVLFSLNNPIYVSGMPSGNNDYGLKVADSTQMTWIDIQGLPWGTSPASQPMTMGGSVLNRGKALLVVPSGSALFTIPLYRCPSPTQYWDGAGCVEHACVRPSACGGGMEAMDGGCVCRNGYYKNPISGSCVSCSSPYYCDRVSLITCPVGTATTKSGASSVNDCICSVGGSFFNALASQPRCVECKTVDTWCPNRWLSFSCPGTFTTSMQLLTTPISFPTKCSCAPGYTGVNCELCPEGFYCPVSTTSLAMNTAAYYTFTPTPLSSLVIGYIHNFFLSYFTQPGTKIPNMNSVQDLNKVLYIQKVQATNQTKFGIMVMVQVDIGGGPVDNFKGWNRDLFEYLKSLSTNVSDVMPTSNSNVDFSMVPVNKPLQCLTSKVPGSPPSSCICAAGYETQKEQCSACPVNTFKALAGPGTCSACAIGTVSPIKASACIPDPSLLNPNQETGGPNTTLLIGGIVGGVAGLICLLFVVQLVIKRGQSD